MMLADGGADFAKAIGAEMDTQGFGGIRLKRLAMLVNVSSAYRISHHIVICVM
jgi:peroxiredoxin